MLTHSFPIAWGEDSKELTNTPKLPWTTQWPHWHKVSLMRLKLIISFSIQWEIRFGDGFQYGVNESGVYQGKNQTQL